jgi:hypothetical protein
VEYPELCKCKEIDEDTNVRGKDDTDTNVGMTNARLKQGKAIMLDGITDLNRLVQFPVEYEGKNFEDIAELGNYIQEQAEKDTAKKIFEKIFEVICCFSTKGKSEEYNKGYIDCLAEVDKRLQNLAQECGEEVD